jgi:hypothetical protein
VLGVQGPGSDSPPLQVHAHRDLAHAKQVLPPRILANPTKVLAAAISLGVARLLRKKVYAQDSADVRRQARLDAHIARLDGTCALEEVSAFKSFCNGMLYASEVTFLRVYSPKG